MTVAISPLPIGSGNRAFGRRASRRLAGGPERQGRLPDRPEATPSMLLLSMWNPGDSVVLESAAPPRPGRRARRRRPSGAPPPLRRDLRVSGVGWFAGAAVAVI